MRPVSTQVVPSLQTKLTTKVLASAVPVASVADEMKLVPKVMTYEEVPEVRTTSEKRAPATPPVTLSVMAPVGVTVRTPSSLGRTAATVPVAAESADVAALTLEAMNAAQSERSVAVRMGSCVRSVMVPPTTGIRALLAALQLG